MVYCPANRHLPAERQDNESGGIRFHQCNHSGQHDRQSASTTYYCVPDATNTNVWTVSLNDNGEPKSAQFVNEQNWESGKNYIYIFSLEKKTPKLLYVVSQDLQYFDCNDIVPGGEFSNKDMTE